ncbi:MAG: hypothetical protein IV100_29090 [Myxococcales bacterium]|nr:hypothetical protein [Myxococcales bacterium]
MSVSTFFASASSQRPADEMTTVSPARRQLVLTAIATALLVPALVAGCAASRAPLRAEMPALNLPAAPAPLTRDHFKRDEMPTLGEDALRDILAAPVFLEERSRIGVVRVADAYRTDYQVPLAGTTGALATSLENTGHFEVVTEVSTDWPTDSGVAGLRELAARYRCEYLLLYRERFVDATWTNGLGALWLTIIGGLMVPETTMEVAGVLEATLFDVRTGTLLFTVFERVQERTWEFVYAHDQLIADKRTALAKEGMKALTATVAGKIGRLTAARPKPSGAIGQGREDAPKRDVPTAQMVVD